MYTDKKLLYALSILLLAVLLCVTLFFAGSGRILSGILLLPLAVLFYFLIKKRSIYAIERHQVLLIMSVIGLSYLMLYYLTGLHFGFAKTGYRFNLNSLFNFILPITANILCVEIIRAVVRGQNSRIADALCYIACVLSQVLTQGGFGGLHRFQSFMDLVGLTFFPAILSNLLFHYLAGRYGPWPNVAFRLITTLYVYVIPYKSRIPDSLLAFVSLLLPALIYFFIDALFAKKKRYALGKKNRLGPIITGLVLLIMAGTILLISNQFRFGALVIATDSMTGELNKGDVAIFQKLDDRAVELGQVVVFEKDGSTVVHRLVDAKRINGQLRYFTKGDANEQPDTGYITQSQLIGTVDWKVPYFGYPTLWLRELFS